MQVWITRLCAGLLIALTAGAAGWYAGAQESTTRTLKVNEVARVGERVISAEEFIERLIKHEQTHLDPDLRTAAWALDSLVLDEMLRLEAERLEARPNGREIREEAARVRELYEAEYKRDNDQIKLAGGQPYESFEQWLETKLGLTLAQFESHQSTAARQRLTTRMVVNYWRMSTRSADAEGLRCRTQEDAIKARARLARGEKIAIVAREMSNERHTREKGGVIGTVYPKDGTLEPEVEKVFWELEKNELSQPIKTDGGFWVVRKTHEQLANEAPFYDLRPECIKPSRDVDASTLQKWRHAVAASGRYAFERRMPGWDVQAGE